MTDVARDTLLQAAFAHHQGGALDDAETLYRRVLALDPDNLNALQLLGLLVHARDRSPAALELLEHAAAVADRRGDCSPHYAVLHNNLGNALRDAGRGAEAAAHYRRGLAFDPDLAELNRNLGNALLAQNDLVGAVASYEEARRRNVITAACLCRLAGAYAALDQFALAEERCREADAAFAVSAHAPSSDAIEALAALTSLLIEKRQAKLAVEVARRLAALAPDRADAHHRLAVALRDSGDSHAAMAAFKACLDRDPDYVAALYDLGVLAARTGLYDAAVALLDRAIAVRPDDASSHVELGNALQHRGDTERALGCFRRAVALRPFTIWPARHRPPVCSALVLTSPGGGNVPPDFLLGDAAFDCHFYALLPGATPDLDALRSRGDIVINLICDVDQGRQSLIVAADLVDRLGMPVINHPRNILATGRDAIAGLLSGTPGCRMPATIRCARDLIAAPDAVDQLRRLGSDVPLLLRVAGTHGGDAFEKMSDAGDIAAFVGRHPADEFYVTAYADYRSPDSYFRKYRFVFTNGEILPYHLAISDHWKVHHFRTDMARHVWMQDEEKAFLDDPGCVFSAAHDAILRRIGAAIDLAFFGIDCALDRDGNLVVFEVNASMLIHDDNAAFPYKTPACLRIKQAFAAAVASFAGAGGAPSEARLLHAG